MSLQLQPVPLAARDDTEGLLVFSKVSDYLRRVALRRRVRFLIHVNARGRFR